MADNIAVSPGSGATIAADDIGSVLYQRVKPQVGADGAAADVAATNPFPVEDDTRAAYVVTTGNIANVNATVMFDLFNLTGSGVVLKVCDLRISQLQTAVSGIGLTFDVTRTSAAGTGGTVLTTQKMNTANATLSANITARTKPTAGATTAATLFTVNSSSEDLSPYQASGAHLNLLPVPLYLNANEGLKITETLGSAVGSSCIIVTFNVI